jgi:hypothetical protein
MKKIAAILAVLFAVTIQPVHAETPKTLVIIDTGVDMSHPALNNIVYEVCVAGYKSCPNGQNFMEGKGAANVTSSMYSNEAWSHGTKVASLASGIPVIEIRCASLIGTNGYLGCNANTLTTALNWVIDNKNKFNIVAVASPLGSYSTTCDLKAAYVAPINKLNSLGVAIMFPTGNDFKYVSIDNPACVPGVIAVSATEIKIVLGKTQPKQLALYANYSDRVDFADDGGTLTNPMTVAIPGGSMGTAWGTSLSVVNFATKWVKVLNAKNLSYNDEYNLIKNTADSYTNIMVKKNVLAINIAKALQ